MSALCVNNESALIADWVPEWARPAEMNGTYSFLYCTLAVRNAPYLPAQMEPELWKLVYGQASVRNRKLSWARARGDNLEARAFVYSEERLTEDVLARVEVVKERIALLRASADIEGVDKKALIDRERASLDRLMYSRSVTRFLRPPRVTPKECGGRSFEVQCHDVYLCGMHALNNVANSVVLTPPDILQAIELNRSLDSKFASLEELSLAALREGIFLYPLRLTDVADLNPLDPSEPTPRRKYCLELIKRAGGLIVYDRLLSDDIGHYVSLVYTRAAIDERRRKEDALRGEEDEQDADDEVEEVRDESYDWCIFSFDEVVAHGPTCADALDNYFFNRLAEGVADESVLDEARQNKKRDQRRATLNENVSEELYFLGLLPISLSLMRQDAQQGVDFTRHLSRDDVEWLHILRTLVRRSLSEMSAQPSADQRGVRDINMARSVSPGNLDTLCEFMVANSIDRHAPAAAAEDSGSASTGPEHTRFDGLDTIVPASVINVRYVADEEINKKANSLAALLLRTESESDRVPMVQEVRELLATLRSYMLSMPGLGLFFAPTENFEKMARLVSNRRWFRYLALVLGTGALIERLDATGELDEPFMQCLRLLCFVAYCSMQSGGVKLGSSWRSIEALYLSLSVERRRALLPLAHLPSTIEQAVRSEPATMRSPFAAVLLHSTYDTALWLLKAVDELAPLPIDVHPFHTTVADNCTLSFDQTLAFVILLRQTLFKLPYENNDFPLIDGWMPAQPAREPTMASVSNHFILCACQFRLGVQKARLATVDVDQYIDVLGFDKRFAPGIREQPADYKKRSSVLLADLSVHELLDRAPRFAERMVQMGVSELYKQVFGALVIRPDNRQAIVDNLDRIPLPTQPGIWHSTRPRVVSATALLTSPLTDLPTMDRSVRESTRHAIENEEVGDEVVDRRVKRRLEEPPPAVAAAPAKPKKNVAAFFSIDAVAA